MGVQTASALKLLVACSGCRRQYDAGGLKPGSRFHCSCGKTVEVPRPKSHEADVVRCSSCSAPRLKGATSCAHCGSDYTLHERDLHTICPSCMTRISDRSKFCHNCGTPIVPQGEAGRPTDTKCPVCGDDHELNSRALGDAGIAVLECPQCAGLWIGTETFRLITERARATAGTTESAPANRVLRSASELPKQSGSMYRRCPECKKMMNRRNFGRGSGVIIDSCKDHGIWFDAQELDRILSWIRRGGEIRNRAKEQAEHRARQARADRLRVESIGWRALGDSSGLGYRERIPGSMIQGLLGSLFDI